jgi:hypothetical protein
VPTGKPAVPYKSLLEKIAIIDAARLSQTGKPACVPVNTGSIKNRAWLQLLGIVEKIWYANQSLQILA